jgi:nucleotide-binding universal stress UspA family protein
MKSELTATQAVAQVRWREILVPMDVSNESVQALELGVSLARQLGASVTALHVVQLNIRGEELDIPRTRILNEMREQAHVQLGHMVNLLGRDGVPVTIEIAEGRPWKEILKQAKQLQVNLIVMAEHQYRGIMRLLHPHTVTRVMRHAHCPVIVVRDHTGGLVEA